MSWTKEEYIPVKDGELEVIDKILHNNMIPKLEFLADASHEKQNEYHHDHPVIEEQE